jgi:hypothetical protein
VGIQSAIVGVPESTGPVTGGGFLRNIPNPFAASTAIAFTLARAENVSLGVYDAAGRQVASLLRNAPLDPGTHRVEFVARGLPNGLYFCRLKAGERIESRKLVLAH